MGRHYLSGFLLKRFRKLVVHFLFVICWPSLAVSPEAQARQSLMCASLGHLMSACRNAAGRHHFDLALSGDAWRCVYLTPMGAGMDAVAGGGDQTLITLFPLLGLTRLERRAVGLRRGRGGTDDREPICSLCGYVRAQYMCA